jgi:TnpA family transposase
MPRRNLLSSEQRNRLFAVPTDPAEMARHYVLSRDDLTVIRTKRRPINRLGFAIQLCLLRHPGQGMGPGEYPPGDMIAFIVHQLGLSSAKYGDYALRDQTRREHAVARPN